MQLCDIFVPCSLFSMLWWLCTSSFFKFTVILSEFAPRLSRKHDFESCMLAKSNKKPYFAILSDRKMLFWATMLPSIIVKFPCKNVYFLFMVALGHTLHVSSSVQFVLVMRETLFSIEFSPLFLKNARRLSRKHDFRYHA